MRVAILATAVVKVQINLLCTLALRLAVLTELTNDPLASNAKLFFSCFDPSVFLIV